MIPVNSIEFKGNEEKYVLECIRSGWISSEGEFVSRFEVEMAKYVGRKYAVAVANGTAALEIAVKALKLPMGSEIIVPDATIISCIGAILKAGHIPVLVDLNDDWNMCLDSIRRSITPRTKAILGVNLYGYFPNWNELINLTSTNGIFLIEDAAQTFGGVFSNKKSGSLGDISTTSFYPNKQITTGEGGMIFTDDIITYNSLKSYRNLCFGEGDLRFKCTDIGWNYRMTNIQAAIGLAQLEQIENTIQHKRELGEFYQNKLAPIKSKQWILPSPGDNNCENVYWVFGLQAPNKTEADRIKNILSDNKIGWRPFYFPYSLMNMGGFKTYVSLEKGKQISDSSFYIPCGRATSLEEAEVVARLLVDHI
jgi:perosamine synthetase